MMRYIVLIVGNVTMRRQTLWIALTSVLVFGSTASYADFIDDSQVQLKFKNFYLDRQYDHDVKPDFGSWSQAATLDAKSGYEKIGPVEVGVDVLAQYAVRLSSDRGTADWIMPFEDGKQKRDNLKIGATLKVKASKTELKVGELLPISPVLVYDPSRQLLTTYDGAWLESKELKNTKITLAYIDGINTRYGDQYQELTLFPYNNVDHATPKQQADGMYIAGVDYQATQDLGLSYWFADVKDIYQQNYAGVSYNTNLNDKTRLLSHVRYFDNRKSGDALYGDIENQALSIGAKVKTGPHSFGLGWQQMFGPNGGVTGLMPTLGGWVPQPYLVNWSIAGFIRKEEKSWQVSYGYDFKDVGLKGLTADLSYIRGFDVNNGAGKDKGRESETTFVLNYTVPEGKLKGLGFQWMYMDSNYKNVNAASLVENRLATTYTYHF